MNSNEQPSDASFDAVEIRKARVISAHGEQVVSGSTFHAWRLDPAFLKIYAYVQQHTLVDIMRCHELWNLVTETAKIEGDILEVGVWRGGTGCIMAAQAQMIGRKGDVFLCDTFRGVAKAGDHDLNYVGGEHADTDIDVVNRLLMDAGYAIPSYSLVYSRMRLASSSRHAASASATST